MIHWTDCPGDGPVVTKRIESLSVGERRHLDAMVKLGHIKNEFAKMRREDYARRYKCKKPDHGNAENSTRDGVDDSEKWAGGKWPTQK